MTLKVFSGREDPQWNVQLANPQFKEMQRLLAKARSDKLTCRPEDMIPRLGYKGFLVKDTMTRELELIVGSKTVALQLLMLQSMPSEVIPEKFRKIVMQEIESGEITADENSDKRLNPSYLQNKWISDSFIISHNNCYNYANDKITSGTFAQPGRGGGQVWTHLTGPNVRAAARLDGLRIVNIPPPFQGLLPKPPLPSAPAGPWRLLALSVSPGTCKIKFRFSFLEPI